MIRLILEFLLILFLAFVFILNGFGWLTFVFVAIWLTRSVQTFLVTKRKNAYMKEKGYEKSPIFSSSKLISQLLKNNLENVQQITFGTTDQFMQDQNWADAMNQYQIFNPTSTGSSSLGTSNVWANIVGGYFLQKMMQNQLSKIPLVIVSEVDGKYKFAVNTGITKSSIQQLTDIAMQRGVPLIGEISASEAPKSFRLTS